MTRRAQVEVQVQLRGDRARPEPRLLQRLLRRLLAQALAPPLPQRHGAAFRDARLKRKSTSDSAVSRK